MRWMTPRNVSDLGGTPSYASHENKELFLKMTVSGEEDKFSETLDAELIHG